MAPGIASGQSELINPALSAASARMLPMQAAASNAAGIGGLLGQYQTQQSKTSNPWGPMLGQFISSLVPVPGGGTAKSLGKTGN
jgi:hypothetical protein